MVFQKVYDMLQTDNHRLAPITAAILLLPKRGQNRIWFFGTWFQNVILNLFIDFFLSLVCLDFKCVSQLVFFLNFFNSKIGIDLVLVFIGKRVNLRVRLKIKLLIILYSFVFLCEIPELITEFRILFIFQTRYLVHLFEWCLEKLI